MRQSYRACFSAYIVFTLLWSFPLALSIYVGFKHSDWTAALICAGILLFCFLWLSRFRLLITPEQVTYRSLFGGQRSVRCSDIARVQFASRTGPVESPFTLVIYSSGGDTIRINAKVFPWEALKKLSALRDA